MISEQEIDKMIQGIIKREGGYVNHPQDPGGETKYGISKRSYPTEDIKGLTVERASGIYRRDFVDKYRIAELDNYRTAELVLDWLVHSGPLAVRTIQRRLGATVDGIIGEETIGKINGLDPRMILKWRLDFLVGLTGHPFIKGWIKRLYELGL